MGKKIKILLLLLILTASSFAITVGTEGHAAYLNDGSGNFLLGVGFNLSQNKYTHTIRLVGWGESRSNSTKWPGKYLLGYSLNGLHFYPGVGFVKNNAELFVEADASIQNAVFGGIVDTSASILTGSAQLKLYYLPPDFTRKALEITTNPSIAKNDKLLSMFDMRPGFTAYTRISNRISADAAYELGYFGNFTENSLQNFWFSWVLPDFAYGSAAFGSGIEFGERGYLPKGLYVMVDYKVPLNDILLLDLNMSYGSLKKDQSTGKLALDPHAVSRMRLTMDTTDSQWALVSGWESVTRSGWLGEKITGYGDFKWKIEYKRKDNWPFTIYASKDSNTDFALGMTYKF